MVLRNQQIYWSLLLKFFSRNLIKSQIYIYNPQSPAKKNLLLSSKNKTDKKEILPIANIKPSIIFKVDNSDGVL